MRDCTKRLRRIFSTVFVFSLYFITVSTYGTDYYVSVSGNDSNDGSQAKPYRTIAKAAAAVPAGSHTIRVAAGTYEEKVIVLQPGVSLQGAGIDQTIIRNGNFTWYEGAIKLHNPTTTSGNNQSVSGFTLDGKSYSCYVGIQVQNRSNVKIFNVKISQFYHAGIELTADFGMQNQNIEIYNFDIRESARESGGGSFGNITSRGKILNLQVHDGVIYHLTNVPIGIYGDRSSGYAIKCLAAWGNGDFSNDDFVSKSRFYNIKEYGKSFAPWGPNVPNISFEFWHIAGEEVEIANCDFTTHLSLEWDGPATRGAYSFWVHDSRFAVEMGQSMELTTSNAIVENNTFDYRPNKNAWNVFGEYNKKSKGGRNIHIRRNYFILGDRSPIIWALGNPTQDLYFYNNTISGTGTPSLFQIRSTSSGVASRNLQVFNNAFDLSGSGVITAVNYEGGTSQPQGMVLTNNHHGKAFGSIPSGASVASNQQTSPALVRTGALPLPFLSTGNGSALIDAGKSGPTAPIALRYSGNAPDIGAYESGQSVQPPANQNPVVSLTAPTNNATYPAGSSITLSANASDSDGSVSKVEFFAGTSKIGEKTSAPYSVSWPSVSAGSYSVTARATDEKGGVTTSAAITVTISAVNQNPVVSLTSPASNASITEGNAVTLTATATDSDGSIAKVEFFAGTTKLGESTTSPYSFSWINPAVGTYSLTVKATDDKGAVTTSSTSAFNVIAKPVNQVPTISLTAPTNNAKFEEGNNVTLTANASDSDGTIAKVEFFSGSTKLGEKTSAPFTFDWSDLAVGSFSLTAKATDDKGATTTSSAIAILVEVKVIPNQNPVVSLVAPANNASFTEGENATLTANATDSDGSISKVEFYSGSTKLGESTQSPYSFNWTNLAVGSYSLTAKATDNKGGVATSSAITVTVVAKAVENQNPIVSLTAPVNNSTVTEGASVTLTATASDSDGSISKVEFYSGSTKLGESAKAPYSFVWDELAVGTYSLTAKATDDKGATATSTAVSVTVEAKVIPNEAPVVSLSAPTNNATVTEGDDISVTANASDSDGSVAKVEFFANSIKIGEKTSAPFDMAWSGAAAGTYNLTARATDDKGAVTTSSLVKLVVNQKPVTNPPPTNENPVVSLTGPANNASITEGQTIAITASASDADGSVAKVEFYADNVKIGESATSPYAITWANAAVGTYSLTAKVTDDKGAAVVSTAINVTVNAKPNQNPVVSLVAPANNASFTEGENATLTANATDSDGSITKVEFYSGSTKLGESTQSPYSFNWTNLAVGSYSLTAKATDNKGGVATSSAITVTVVAKAVENQNPIVSLTAPVNNSTVTEGASVTLTATASDSDGSIAKVEFYAGSTKLGESTTSPYSFNWTNVSVGTYSLTAKATDNKGATVSSTAVSVTVSAKPVAANQNPVVSLTSPTNNASFTEGDKITLSATASDADGTIAKVEFYSGSTKLGESTSSPYSFVWNNVSVGSYSLTAKATDNKGATASSTAIAITVKAKTVTPPVTTPNAAPVIALTAPANNTKFTEGNNATLTATATDSDGTVSKVEFFSGTTKLGESTTAPYSFAWTNLVVGSYSITAKATDDKGATATSTALSIVVDAKPVVVAPKPNQAPSVVLISPANAASVVEGTTVTITANASDSDGSVAKVEFFINNTKIGEKTSAPYTLTWPAVIGTQAITAKATDNANASTISSAVTITVTPIPNQLPTVAITSPANNARFTAGNAVALTASASDADGSVAKVEFFAGTTKLGESTTSPYSFNWASVAQGNYALTAIATDNKGGKTTSSVVTIYVVAPPVVVNPTPPAANKVPTISLTSPTTNGTYTTAQTVPLIADAKDADGVVTKVEFFANEAKIGEKTGSPWTLSTTLKEGTYSLTAVATDDKGSLATSNAVSIKIAKPIANSPQPAPNKAPVVSLTAPANNASVVEGSNLTLTATATDSDGSITKVEFYSGSTKLGESTQSPYSFNWTNLSVGTYSLTAKATDNKGGVASSTAVSVTVSAKPVAANQNPVVSLTSPTNNASFTEGNNVTLTANASDSDGTIAKVEFYSGSTKLGESTSSPYSFVWNNVSVGSYSLTAKATDNKGATASSTAIAITVKAKTVTPPVTAPVTPPVATTPTFYRAINLNGPAMEIDGNKWGGSDAANYTYSGTSMSKPTITLAPETDKNRTAMIRSAISGRNVTVAMTSVPNATYDVYLYVWEAASAQTYSVYLEGKAVQANYNSGSAGTWKRLGPFRQSITDKTINITTSGGTAHVSGIEVWQVPVQQAAIAGCSATGYILRETWENVAPEMSTLIPAYKKPDNSSQLSLFEAPTNVGDNYSSRIRGYICPPATGSYTFWISGDAEAELWLGLSEDPSTKTKIASVSEATNPREWGKSATQQSATIQLEKGKKYYIEAVHKAYTGNDHLAVGWQMPGGIQEMPIAGVRLSPYVPTENEFELPALASGSMTLFPNPAVDQTNVRFNVNEDQDAVISITSFNAQQVLSVTEPVRAGENIVPLAVANLSKGVYVVTVQVKEGRFTQKLIVTR